MSKRVLFLGEDSLTGAGRYLAAILTWSRIPFDYRSDQTKIPKAWRKRHYDAIILSDYRYSSWTPCAKEWLTETVTHHGTGLMMIGGWASFTGQVGRYAGTEIERLLPVRCVPGDDRVNESAVMMGNGGAPVMVCGYHRIRPKPGSRIELQFRPLKFSGGRPVLGKAVPALVTGQAGKGRTLAFLTDCAPHWAGGLVDWGRTRISVTLKFGISVEVGNTYLTFFRSWISWVSQLSV